VVIVACHLPLGYYLGKIDAGKWSVTCFFVMSGYVLARAYDGRPIGFMVRRIVRLWPLYALSMCAGHLVLGTMIPFGELVWAPSALTKMPAVNPPAWSLFMEAWATPMLLPLFFVASRSRVASLGMPVICIALTFLDWRLYFMQDFAIGVAAAQFNIKWPRKTPGVLVWLGNISYSLYITHGVVLMAWTTRVGVSRYYALPLVFLVASLSYHWVERPSIMWSRAAARAIRIRSTWA